MIGCKSTKYYYNINIGRLQKRSLLLLHYLKAHGHSVLLSEHIDFYDAGSLMAVNLTDLALESLKRSFCYCNLLAFHIAVRHLDDVVRASEIKEEFFLVLGKFQDSAVSPQELGHAFDSSKLVVKLVGVFCYQEYVSREEYGLLVFPDSVTLPSAFPERYEGLIQDVAVYVFLACVTYLLFFTG